MPDTIALEVLGEAQGRLLPPDERARKFSRALFPRTTNRYGCVTLQSYHFYVAAGLPKTQVLLWGYGNALRAVFDTVVVAESHCHDNRREGKVTDSRAGCFPPTRFASPQGALLPLNPHEALVLYRPQPALRHARGPVPTQPLWLFERMMAEKPSRGMPTGIGLQVGVVLQSQNTTCGSTSASYREKNRRCQAGIFPNSLQSAYVPTGGKDLMAGFAYALESMRHLFEALYYGLNKSAPTLATDSC